MKFRVVHVNPGEKLNKNGNYNDIIQKSLVFPILHHNEYAVIFILLYLKNLLF